MTEASTDHTEQSEELSGELRWTSGKFADLGPAELYRFLQLRQDIFIIEQNCLYRDLDDLDEQALHIGAWRGEELLGYLRCLPPGVDYEEAALGRIAVSPGARGLQLGRRLVERGIRAALEHWPEGGIRIGAQAHLQQFYESLGFRRDSDVYDEDGIPHIKMVYEA